MKYLLRMAGLGRVPEIKITAKEYSDLEKARNILSNALEIEEKYEIVITNYLDFEKQILDITADSMVRGHLDYSDFFDIALKLNIRLVNLLTAVRLYVDQLNQNVQECVPDVADVKEVVKKFFSKEYDDSKEYCFMEALRNHVQHRGIPVHQTELRISFENGSYCMELASLRSRLEQDSKFNKKVIKKLDKKIDLKAVTRSYVGSISSVHDSVRNMIKESVASARKLIEKTHCRYATDYKGDLTSLSACKLEDGKQVSAIPLLLKWDDIRVEFQKRNKKIPNLKKLYVTSSLKTHNK